MIQRKKMSTFGDYPPPLNQCEPRHMVMQLQFDREAFQELKELLREGSKNTSPVNREESITPRIKRESLKRVFDQIRDVEYDDQ